MCNCWPLLKYANILSWPSSVAWFGIYALFSWAFFPFLYLFHDCILVACTIWVWCITNTTAVMFVKSFCVTISLSGTDDVVARYTCFMFSLFAKQLIPNPTMLLLSIALAGFSQALLNARCYWSCKEKEWSWWNLSRMFSSKLSL